MCECLLECPMAQLRLLFALVCVQDAKQVKRDIAAMLGRMQGGQRSVREEETEEQGGVATAAEIPASSSSEAGDEKQ